ncbi:MULTISPECIES: TonB-dependent receptor [unclassified Halomonas]|uniref:TonB-dependent receptor n=1 Tax=unclassified Halomonas TaxID=2609666 RepID=UPI0020A1D4B3|nr:MULTISPECIES: TonB-dependent receptor [unclassified Halomonas]MCP1313111.1 TonB-dependent receptor [Halomonas sp. 707D7]MCP1325939.1 TonB-dependent receptor [Halomonas sp. 707D4]
MRCQHHRARWQTATLVGLMAASQAQAQEQSRSAVNAGREQVEQPVVVTASRTSATKEDSPQTVRVITSEEIEQQLQLTSDSSQILSNLLPSYSPSRQKMSGSGETLRGRRPLILIDGIPQSNPLRPTGREAHTIDFSMVEQIEVIQGANATNGIGAEGGVINLVTRRPEPGSFNQHVEAQVTTPTRELDGDTLSYRTTYGVSGNSGDVDYLFSASLEDQGLFLDGNGDAVGVDNTQGDLMDARSFDILGKLAYWFDDDQRLQFTLNHYDIEGHNGYLSVTGDRDNGVVTTSRRGTPEGRAPYNRVWTTGLSYDHYDLAGMHLSAQVYYQDYKALFGADNSATFQDPAFAPVGTFYDQTLATTSKYGTKVSLSRDDLLDDRLKLTGGFDTLFDDTEQYLYQTDRTYVPPASYTDLSPFLQAEFAPLDSLLLSAGVRYEYAKLDIDDYQTLYTRNAVDVEGGSPSFNETLYNLGAVWKPVEHWSLFANYSEGFTIPDVGRALRSIQRPGQSVDSIENLRPIVTDNVETGVRYDDGRLAAELNYYISSSDFGSRLVERDDAFFMARQETEIKGLEAAIGYRFTDQHAGRLSYSRMRGRYDSNDDGHLDASLSGIDVAPDRVVASVSSDWTDNLSTFVQANYAMDMSFDEPEREFDGYLLMDAAVGYRLPVGQMDVGISNLLDEQYVTYYSQSALVNDERYFAGRGRTLTLGYRLDF